MPALLYLKHLPYYDAHFPELRLVATTLSDDDVAPWSPGLSER